MTSEQQKRVLQEIVQLDGDCLNKVRCDGCPFKTVCLPEFLIAPKTPPTKNQRFQMALDALMRDIVMNDETPQDPMWKKS